MKLEWIKMNHLMVNGQTNSKMNQTRIDLHILNHFLLISLSHVLNGLKSTSFSRMCKTHVCYV